MSDSVVIDQAEILGYEGISNLDEKEIKNLIEYANYLTHALIKAASVCEVKLVLSRFGENSVESSCENVDYGDRKSFTKKRVMVTVPFLISRVSAIMMENASHAARIASLHEEANSLRRALLEKPKGEHKPKPVSRPFVLGYEIVDPRRTRLCFLAYEGDNWIQTLSVSKAIRFENVEDAHEELMHLLRSHDHTVMAHKYDVMCLSYQKAERTVHLRDTLETAKENFKKGIQRKPSPQAVRAMKLNPLRRV